MDRQIALRRLAESELERNKNLFDKMRFAEKRLPKGSLSERDGALIHRIRDNGVQYSITISECDPIVEEIKQRRYIKEGLPILAKKIKACEQFLKNDVYYDPVSIEQELNDCYSGLLDLGVFLKGDRTAEEWDKINIYKNPAPFIEEHYTSNGEKCRSKSEALLGTRMEERGEVYWYDTALRLADGSVIYPDFKIYQPNRRRLVVLEHFGMMDNPGYSVKAIRRLEKYSQSGFYLGLNLFYTFETRDNPLTMKDIDRKLDEIKALDRLKIPLHN